MLPVLNVFNELSIDMRITMNYLQIGSNHFLSFYFSNLLLKFLRKNI